MVASSRRAFHALTPVLALIALAAMALAFAPVAGASTDIAAADARPATGIAPVGAPPAGTAPGRRIEPAAAAYGGGPDPGGRHARSAPTWRSATRSASATREQVFDENEPNESPAYFEEGFTNDFAADLARPWEAGRGVTLVNDACPGETSNGLIGENAALGGENLDRTGRPRSAGSRRLPPVRV